MTASLTDEITAWSTLAAVIVALGIALAPSLSRFRNRPQLKLCISDEEPHLVARLSDEFPADIVLLRLEVANDGRGPADGVWCTLERRWYRELQPGQGVDDPPGTETSTPDPNWRLVDDEPALLTWAHSSADQADIPSGSRRFVQLASFRHKTLDLHVGPALGDGLRDNPDGGLGTHRVELMVGGTGIKPITQVVEFIVDGKNFIRGASFTSSPAKADDKRLMKLLRSFGADEGV